MSQPRQFHLGDILSITTGRLLSPSHIGGVYEILNYLTGDNLYTHQLGRGMEMCTPWLLRQFPQLAELDASGVTPANHLQWLAEQVEKFGEFHAVETMPREMWLEIDPVEELRAMVGDDKVIVVGEKP